MSANPIDLNNYEGSYFFIKKNIHIYKKIHFKNIYFKNQNFLRNLKKLNSNLKLKSNNL